MAKYTITHACGHSVEIALYGSETSRTARIHSIEEDDCTACRAAGSNLTGSVKQVAWAEDIRAAAMPKVVATHADWTAKVAVAPAPEDAKAAVQAAIDGKLADIMARTAARDWIENRHPELEIYEACRAAMIAANKAAK